MRMNLKEMIFFIFLLEHVKVSVEKKVFKIGMSLTKETPTSAIYTRLLSVDSIGGAFNIAFSDCRKQNLLDDIDIR